MFLAVRVFHGIGFFDTHISARHSRALNGAHLPNLGEAAYTYLGRRELSFRHLPIQARSHAAPPRQRSVCGHKAGGHAAAEASSLSTQISFPRAAMNALIVQLRAHHHARRCRGLASSTFVRDHGNFQPLHSPTRQTGHGTASPATGAGGCVQGSERLAFSQAIPPRRTALFSRIVLAPSGGTSRRSTAARTGRVRVLLERNPPNRPLVPAGTPALRRESNPAPQN